MLVAPGPAALVWVRTPLRISARHSSASCASPKRRGGGFGAASAVASTTEVEAGALEREDAKRKLLAAIANFREVQKRDGTERVDFGVRGGELDKKSRAPRNLAADGAFYRVSDDLGKAADLVMSLVEGLAPLNPSSEPFQYFGTASGQDCPLHGTWRLLFTTAADATFSSNSTRGDAAVSNIVDAVAGTVTNCIDFKSGDGGTLPVLESLRVHLTAEAESDVRLALAFRFVKARITRFFGIPLGSRRLTLTLPVPGPFVTRILSFFTRKAPPRPYFDIMFLDDTLRVHRTGEGNVFVQQRS